MKLFKMWLLNYIRSGVHHKHGLADANQPVSIRGLGDRPGGHHFTIYKASNGYVVDYRKWCNKLQDNASNLYIITEDQDFYIELGKIVTVELLRN